MVKISKIRLTAVLTFIVGFISLVLGLYVSWKFSILPGAVAGSAIVISMILYSLSRLKIRVEIEKVISMLRLILILVTFIGIFVVGFIGVVIYVAVVVVQFNALPQIMSITYLAISAVIGSLIITTKQKQFYLFINFIEVAYIVLSNVVFMNLQLYNISNILPLTIITAVLMIIVTKHCRKRVNFISLLKEFVIKPISDALSWLIFTIPFMLISVSTLVILDRISLSDFNAIIRMGLVLVAAFWSTTVIAVKMYKECNADGLIVFTLAILILISLIYILGISRGWIELSPKSLRDLESILVLSFTFIPLFVHAPMICLLSNKDKCVKLS